MWEKRTTRFSHGNKTAYEIYKTVRKYEAKKNRKNTLFAIRVLREIWGPQSQNFGLNISVL
jgi:hypothetical protein